MVRLCDTQQQFNKHMKKDDSLANMPRGTSYEINARSPITFRTLEQELATISVIAACMTTRVPGTPNQALINKNLTSKHKIQACHKKDLSSC